MANYNKCQNECSDFYYDKDKKQCTFKRMCIALELPIRKKVCENEDKSTIPKDDNPNKN